MISFHEALELLLKNVTVLPVEPCRLENASGRTLCEDITADRDFPAFDWVMMDGHTLRIQDWEMENRNSRVTKNAPAKKPQAVLSQEIGSCVEVINHFKAVSFY
ncbi:MAG: hypothetical protein HC845_12675 [Akkermansiaceae bacterium]|nr:hypothetical protein [Akkermansiaceae bacterium]